MEEQEDDNGSIYTTPLDADNSREENPTDTPTSSHSQSHRREQRPRAYRHSSLPRALFNHAGSSSIFGSGTSTQPQQQEGTAAPPARLSVTPPSRENLVTSQPLSTLAGAEKSRENWFEAEEDEDEEQEQEEDAAAAAPLNTRRIPRVEKDADDINSPPSSARLGVTRRESTTLTTLSRLFAVRAPVSPESSRNPSYMQAPKPTAGYTRNQLGETAALPDHLYTRGLREGRHSDITVHAFGHRYHLHRLILDRAPFFRSALSEPWLEAHAKETTLHPEDIDSAITQSSFELALKRLYGCGDPHEEDRDAVGLFATGCWLEMQALVDSSVESMLRQMTPETLAPLIKLVTGNYYGRAGDKILASAKAMLCRDGWRMPPRYWDGIPADVVREILGGDGFFVDGEWDRWVLAKNLLDRRLKKRAKEAGLVEHHGGGGGGKKAKVRTVPDAANLMAVRFDTVYRLNSLTSSSSTRGMPEHFHRWLTLYTHPDVEPILVLLDEGIHYLHLDFEQLQFIRNARDILGLPVLPEKVIANALWQQMELRQKVTNARDGDMELNLSVRCVDDTAMTTAGASRDTTMSIMTPSSPPPPPPAGGLAKDGGGKVDDVPEHDAEEEHYLEGGSGSGSWDGTGKPRKFWIPSSDCNIVMGWNADPVIATSSSNHTTLQRHARGLSAATIIQPEDVHWASDFAAVTSQPRQAPASGENGGGNGNGNGGGGGGAAESSTGEIHHYTHFPPFRFAAEFPNPRLLKEKKRVYSRTVFYAGSLWNIYIQKVASSRSKQLGVYLHRAKERETEEVIAGTAGLAQGSVDERIGLLEREMILRSERHERRQRRRMTTTTIGGGGDGGGVDADAGELSSDLEIESSARDAAAAGTSAKSGTVRTLLSRSQRKSGQTNFPSSSTSSPPPPPPSLMSSAFASSAAAHLDDILTPDSNSDDNTEDSEAERFGAAAASSSSPQRPHVPTVPPYVDGRPTIKTYFKIYSPSRGGRMLSVYESAPDRFNFSQSWGWKSSTLMLDEGILGGGGGGEDGGNGVDGDGDGGGSGSGGKGRGDGKLRFMVVIGNI